MYQSILSSVIITPNILLSQISRTYTRQPPPPPPPRCSAHSLVGYCQSRVGLWKEAVVNYRLALQINPTDGSTLDLLNDARRVLAGSVDGEEGADSEARE